MQCPASNTKEVFPPNVVYSKLLYKKQDVKLSTKTALITLSVLVSDIKTELRGILKAEAAI
jgi:hypothetical protein